MCLCEGQALCDCPAGEVLLLTFVLGDGVALVLQKNQFLWMQSPCLVAAGPIMLHQPRWVYP